MQGESREGGAAPTGAAQSDDAAAEPLAARAAAVGEIAGRIAHEINNPAAFVTTNLELAALELQQICELEGARAHELHRPLARITECISELRRIGATVRELSAGSRAGRLDVESTDVNDVISRACQAYNRASGGRVDLMLGVLPSVLASGDELEHAVSNMLMNSGDAIRAAGRDDGRIEVTTEPQGDSVVIRIRDNGCGIPRAARGDVFRARADGEAGRRRRGLSVARDIVRRHGGEILLGPSAPGDTTFDIVLPGAPTAGAGSPSLGGPLARARVLLVDDDPQVLSSFSKLIELDHDVVAVDGARAALDLVAEPGANFDVILCDMMMPDLDGVDFLDRLGESPCLAPLRDRVVFISGGTFTARTQAFLAEGKATLLAKPFRRQQLLAAISAKRPR